MTTRMHSAISTTRNLFELPKLTIIMTLVAVFGMVLAPLQQVSAATTFAAPIKVRAFTGGKNIALLWNPALNTTPKKYEIYRDSAKLVTVTAQTSNNMSTTTQRYYDAAVTKGKTYKYQVLAISPASVKSAKTVAISVTHPKAPTPIPTIKIDPALPAEFSAFAIKGKAELETWYPKFASLLATPGYVPPATMTISSRTNVTAAAQVEGTNIVYSDAYLRQWINTPDPIGVLMHESTHVLEQYDFGMIPSMVTEGIADWTRKSIYNDVDLAKPAATAVYNDGYSESAYFFDWITKQYKLPALTRTLNVAAYKGTYSNAIFKQQTGKTLGQLWTQMTGAKVSSIGLLKNAASSRCVYIPDYDASNGKSLQSGECWGITAEQWIFVNTTPTSVTGSLRGLSKCIGGFGFGDNAYVAMTDCSVSNAVVWTPQADGTLKNQNTGRCLQPKDGNPAYGAVLTVAICNSSAIQKWSKLPV